VNYPFIVCDIRYFGMIALSLKKIVRPIPLKKMVRPSKKWHSISTTISSKKTVTMNIKIKRAYLPHDQHDGFRILVDRIWPRGLSRAKAKIDLWLKEIAPSTELRKWFNHDPARWELFKSRYFKELDENSATVQKLLDEIKNHDSVTLLFSSKESHLNNAVALREYLLSR